MNTLKNLGLALILAPVLAASSFATNIIPLKPDSANDAPCTVFGNATPGMSCGKTTAPSGIVDLVGNLNVTGAASSSSIRVSTSAVGATPFVIDGAYTTAQIQAKTPSAAGQLVWNSTLGNVCVSTGAVVQGYKLVGSASTTCQ